MALLVVCLGSFFSPLMMSSVNVAIPAIARDLQPDAVMVSWLPTSFMLAAAVCTLPVGKMADMFGRKRLYLMGMLLSSLGALLAALAGTIELLLGARLVQGAAGAMIFGPGAAVITSVYPPNRLGSALGLQAAAVYGGLMLGPWFGGLVTELFGWRWLFATQVPLFLLVALATLLFLRGEWKLDVRPRFDWSGAFIFGICACALVIGLSDLLSWAGAGLFGIGILGAAAFVYHQSVVVQPLVRVKALRANRIFSYSLVSALFMYGANFPIVFLLSLYLQYIAGLSPENAGRLLIVQAMVVAVMAPFAGRFADRFQPRNIATLGCFITSAGFCWMLLLGYGTPSWVVVVGQLIVGVGFACFSTPNSSAAMRSLTTGNVGVAAALLNLSRAFGNLICMGIVMLIISVNLGEAQIIPEQYDALLVSIHFALALAAAYGVLAAWFSWFRGTEKK
jgi:EmrB/QacA subfamily drug resistance transporter